MANFNTGHNIYNGQLALSGVAVQLTDTNELRYGLNIIAYSGNPGDIFIGNSGVTINNGFPLNKGFSLWIQADSAADVWAVANKGGVISTISWLGT
jgi:hypothetical protein